MTKLSTTTLEILKNFASINPNIIIKSGEPLATISEAKNIMATAEIEEQFDSTFGIYDLNEFIRMHALIGDSTLEFSEDAVVFRNGKSRASYRFADQQILTTPKSKINMPSVDLTITITAEILNQIRKAESVLGHSIVSLQGNSGAITLQVMDPKNPSANTFSVIIDENNTQQSSFDLQFLIANLKVLPGDYNVGVSSKLISHWTNTTAKIQYYIALEKNSTFNA